MPNITSVNTNATVTIGNVPTDDNFGLYTNQANGILEWVDYRVENRYERDGHIYMMGVTSPSGDITGAQAAFVQMAKPTQLWIADWTAARWSAVPLIPDPTLLAQSQSSTGNWILLDEHIQAAMLTLNPDGITGLYRISGTYVYGCVVPSSRTTADVTFPKPPWMGGVFTRTVPQEVLTQGIINNVAG